MPSISLKIERARDRYFFNPFKCSTPGALVLATEGSLMAENRLDRSRIVA
jgi:hypothetical protein